MSTALALYPYQRECLDHAKERNTIVNIPTGRGKTLIAAKLTEHFLQTSPSKKVAFLVPTRALVEQQSRYCRDHVRLSNGSPPLIQTLVGTDQANWDEGDWNTSMRDNHIFLGTEALFQQAFVTDNYLDISAFSLIVFDECHKCVGNAPMAVVMREGVALSQTRGNPCPRILGLTASFVNGSLKNMEQKRRNLEKLMLSTIICPGVTTRMGDDSFIFVGWNQHPGIENQITAVEAHVDEAVQHVGQIKDQRKVITRCTHVFKELGSDALFYYIDKVIVAQIVERAKLLQEHADAASIQCGERMMNGLPALKRELGALKRSLHADPLVAQADKQSLKVGELINRLQRLFRANDDAYRGIVFVTRVALVSSLAKVLNDSLANLGIQCGAVAGSGNQSESERQEQLDKFRRGEIQIIVATAALEEGIDVPECAFVVRYTAVTTTKAHIQGAGRARHANALIFYFENDPMDERQKEAAMNTVAKNGDLALTAEGLQMAVNEIQIPFDRRHPYPFNCREDDDTGLVNVYNCKQIFNQYCSATLGASVQPKKMLYKYSLKDDGRKLLSKVRFPTPNGWEHLSYDDHFLSFWGRANLENIFTSERTKRKSGSDMEEMCFVYIIVVTLREKGYLDCHNQPNKEIRSEARRHCPLDTEWSDAFAIKEFVFQSISGSHVRGRN